MLPFVHRVTKYDPADRDGSGHYTGTEDTDCDDGPVLAAYLAAVRAFAVEAGVERLAIREPGLGSPDTRLPDGVTAYHDGAEVTLDQAIALLRGMLRGDELFCRLEAEGHFFVHVGWDQYVYVGSAVPCPEAVRRTAGLGLFAERLDCSPCEPEPEPGEQCPADDRFWARLAAAVADGRVGLLEEAYVQNQTRWHRLTVPGLDAVRDGLAPRAQLSAWPGPGEDVAAVLGSLSAEESAELVWEDRDGRLHSLLVWDEEELAELPAIAERARAATVLSLNADERKPLLSAVLPDPDGVLRARWRTEPGTLDR
ncbi:RNA-binding protein [Kitasatospora sp. NPDC002040]|uniref:RNA-binding protein n=1 Tax=Kitasatospora sp. NPDC002040 TaxID=3154661 RepID=UPI00331BCFCB